MKIVSSALIYMIFNDKQDQQNLILPTASSTRSGSVSETKGNFNQAFKFPLKVGTFRYVTKKYPEETENVEHHDTLRVDHAAEVESPQESSENEAKTASGSVDEKLTNQSSPVVTSLEIAIYETNVA